MKCYDILYLVSGLDLGVIGCSKKSQRLVITPIVISCMGVLIFCLQIYALD